MAMASRTVSVSAETYARLRAFCETAGVSMSSVVTSLIEESCVPQRAPEHEDLLDPTPEAR